MDYDYFCKILKGELSELPLNRKEKFYTGTILPALLFHNGLNNFYTFLRAIKGFPPEINEAETKDNFLFYTEYNLKQSAGKKKNVGRIIPTETNETPDAIIEILKPKKVFIVIESKMFHNVSQTSLSSQISKQIKAVIEPLKQSFKLKDDQVFHVALVPRMSQCKDGKCFQVINWEFFIDNGKLNFDDSGKLNLQDKYFYNYLKFALDEYRDLVAKRDGTVNGGLEIFGIHKALAEKIIEMSGLNSQERNKYINLKKKRVKAQLHSNPNGVDLAIREVDESLTECKILKQIPIQSLHGYFGANKDWLEGNGKRFTKSPAAAFHIPRELENNPEHPAWKEVEALLEYALTR